MVVVCQRSLLIPKKVQKSSGGAAKPAPSKVHLHLSSFHEDDAVSNRRLMTRMEFLEMLLAESQGAVSLLDASATPAVIPASLALPLPPW